MFVKDLRSNLKLFFMLFLIWGGLSLLLRAFCPMVVLFGLPCPGCGITRAALQLLTFHPLKAWDYNPSLYLWIILVLAAAYRRYWQARPLRALRPLLLFVLLSTIAIFVYRMYRSFPEHPPLIYREGNVLSRLVPSYGNFMHSRFGSAEGMEQHIFHVAP